MPYLLLLLGLVISPSLWAGSWTGTLEDGSVLKVDPETRRPIRYFSGGSVRLWDGTHRLEDGSVIIVREGTVVPTESMLKAWNAAPEPESGMRGRYCEQLVRKTCGFQGECAKEQPCVLAHQLLRLERDEQRQLSPDAGLYPDTLSTSKCLDALSNPAFPTCTRSTATTKTTACGKLVSRVCGEEDQCENSPACDPAKQLLRMETQERLESSDPDAKTPLGRQCEEAEKNPFFTSCKADQP